MDNDESAAKDLLTSVIELTSGVDALYLSGHADLPSLLLDDLELARENAARVGAAVPISLGGDDFLVESHGWGKYRFSLRHEFGRVGLTASDRLPSVRVQPFASYLHAVGPLAVVAWFTEQIEPATGPVTWSASRLDLFADVTGWPVASDDRDKFVCRSRVLTTHEDGFVLSGFTFGKRDGAIFGRIYDKTAEVAIKGTTWWHDKWSSWDGSRVLRVELQYAREALRQFGVAAPIDVLAAAGGLWAYGTEDWLTYRVQGKDSNRSRWDIAPEWTTVQRASMRGDAMGLERVRDAQRVASLLKLLPGLRGYLGSAAVLLGAVDLDDALRRLRMPLIRHGVRIGETFEELLARKSQEFAVKAS